MQRRGALPAAGPVPGKQARQSGNGCFMKKHPLCLLAHCKSTEACLYCITPSPAPRLSPPVFFFFFWLLHWLVRLRRRRQCTCTCVPPLALLPPECMTSYVCNTRLTGLRPHLRLPYRLLSSEFSCRPPAGRLLPV